MSQKCTNSESWVDKLLQTIRHTDHQFYIDKLNASNQHESSEYPNKSLQANTSSTEHQQTTLWLVTGGKKIRTSFQNCTVNDSGNMTAIAQTQRNAPRRDCDPRSTGIQQSPTSSPSSLEHSIPHSSSSPSTHHDEAKGRFTHSYSREWRSTHSRCTGKGGI